MDQKPQPNVLIIEDEVFISDLYVRTLEKAGYTVTVVSDGNDALAQALTDKYDIILLDIMIPNLTGTEILRRLREPGKPAQIHAKIIVTTNLELVDGARDEIESRADGYIVKAEVTPRELATFLDSLDSV
ncbi:response regulator [Candidatus Saccharibacteria bacterium]|nr:response regulator [Candidatus Saccharibacteria bacterium]